MLAPTVFCETGSLIDLEVFKQTRMVGQGALEIHLSLHPCPGITSMYHWMQLFTRVLVIKLQSSCLCTKPFTVYVILLAPLCFLREDLLLPSIHKLGYTGWPVSPTDLPVPVTPITGISNLFWPVWYIVLFCFLFLPTWILAIELMLASQTLYQLSHLSTLVKLLNDRPSKVTCFS